MRIKTDAEMMDTIIGFAEADDRIRAVLLNGSRVNPNVTKDPFQDYDIATFVTDVEPFRHEEHVLPHFGEVLVVEQPLIGPWPPADADGSYYNYNMQFLDGNRIDLSFSHVSTLHDHLADSLTAVLLDKDGQIPELPAPSERSYFITPPTQELYNGCCTGFYFALGSHIPKTLWRRKLPLLKSYMEGWLREIVTKMFGWEIGLRSGWETTLGSNGKHLESLLPADVWDTYRKTYVDSDYENLWTSLFLFHRVFERSAKFVAMECGYRFPQDTADNVLAFLEHVRDMPADAEQIYQR